jgi:G:T/U-mismatch repair DNA glycosylase
MLPEILARNLRVVFVGALISELSDDLGFYHLGPTDRFWSVLEYAGFTPTAVVPASERKILLDVKQTGALNEIYKKFFFEKKESALLKHRVGLTVLNRRRVSGRDDDPGEEPTIDDVQKLIHKIEKYQPTVVAFVTREDMFDRAFKRLYPSVTRQKGKQDFLIGTSEVWLLGSTSGRGKENDAMEQLFDDLAEHLKSLEQKATQRPDPA